MRHEGIHNQDMLRLVEGAHNAANKSSGKIHYRVLLNRTAFKSSDKSGGINTEMRWHEFRVISHLKVRPPFGTVGFIEQGFLARTLTSATSVT